MVNVFVSANCWFGIDLILLPEDFLSKKLSTIEARPHRYPSYFRFLATLNVCSLKT